MPSLKLLYLKLLYLLPTTVLPATYYCTACYLLLYCLLPTTCPPLTRCANVWPLVSSVKPRKRSCPERVVTMSGE